MWGKCYTTAVSHYQSQKESNISGSSNRSDEENFNSFSSAIRSRNKFRLK
jgi:hypothetical protein